MFRVAISKWQANHFVRVTRDSQHKVSYRPFQNNLTVPGPSTDTSDDSGCLSQDTRNHKTVFLSRIYSTVVSRVFFCAGFRGGWISQRSGCLSQNLDPQRGYSEVSGDFIQHFQANPISSFFLFFCRQSCKNKSIRDCLQSGFSTLTMEAGSQCEMSLSIFYPTRRHILDDSCLE